MMYVVCWLCWMKKKELGMKKNFEFKWFWVVKWDWIMS